MDENAPVQVVQKQATVGELIKDYMNGKGITQIAEEYGVAPEKVRDVIQQADREGKFMPKGSTASVDKVSDTPEPLTEGENPPPGKGATFASTKNQP